MKNNVLFLFVFALIFVGGLMAYRPPAPQQGRKAVASQYPTFLFLSDVHLNTQSKTTAYGGDTGMDLWAALLLKIDMILSGPNAPKFVVYTGDLPAHYKCTDGCYLPPSGRAGHNDDIAAILSGLNKIAQQHGKPVFYLPGNNDALAGDYYSYADERQQTPLSLVATGDKFFPSLNATPGAVPSMVSSPHPALGYYSAYPIPGLRLITLNTVIYNANFAAVDGTTQQSDGNTQMSWLAAQLEDAAAKKEKVYVAMHVPPGVDAYSGKNMWTELPGNANWQNGFLKLTMQYRATIAGVLYGHTHMDEVRRLYDTTGTQITEVAISCPGVTPQHYNNPGFKVVQYDATSKELMDFTTYFTTPVAKIWGDSTYSFSKVYSCPSGTTLYSRLITMPLNTVGACMGQTFTVRNGAPTYNINTGIEVKPE